MILGESYIINGESAKGINLIKKGLVHSFKRDIVYDSVVKSYKGSKILNYLYSGMAIIKSKSLSKEILPHFKIGAKETILVPG